MGLNIRFETLGCCKGGEAGQGWSSFVSSFVSRRFESHLFSTVFSSLAESSKMPKMAQKTRKIAPHGT
jgi:hypothetical protein